MPTLTRIAKISRVAILQRLVVINMRDLLHGVAIDLHKDILDSHILGL